ncbi:riboflavin kinase [Cryptosporangium aurantiacum]|uniref:riboflavin kinase n=1 Tax=Cryptosporangium aurantiacum TaxID=134849 RepID=A0A1M7RNN8_9ACTN|nr:riboflavin kinase [Cryptosporangium aurantiacum]SHN47933.1 riboflavin kinase / FMN adenylyltransferase [Cryptosporangium aurantiacum]
MTGPIVVQGVVRPGDRRGRLLGFPTANLHDTDAVRLDGVYAGAVLLDDAGTGAVPAVVSVGRRPTYYGGEGVRLLEAYLLDWAGDLYGRLIRVELHRHLRPQRRFEGTADLIGQIARDVAATRTWAGAGSIR